MDILARLPVPGKSHPEGRFTTESAHPRAG
jgi:hypothetical protein